MTGLSGNNPGDNNRRSASRQRALWLVFAASILLNAFFIGWWSMGCIASHSLDRQPGHAAQKRFDRAVSHLDPQYQDKARQLVDAENKIVRQEGDTIIGLFAQLRDVMIAPQFDAAKFDALHRQIDDHDRALKDSFSTSAKAIAQSLPDAERIKFFKAACPDQKVPPPGK